MALNGLFIGLTTIDIQYYVDTFPKPNVKVKTKPPEILVGGPATNAAVAFSVLGGNASLVSAAGKNSFNKYINDDFSKYQIFHSDLIENESSVPVLATVLTTIENGDRTIITNNPQDVNTNISIENIFRDYKINVVLLDGFYPKSALVAAKIAKKNKIPVVIDCGSWKPQYNKLLQFVDYALCAENFLPDGCLDVNETIKFLSEFHIRNIVITRGAKSILWTSGLKSGQIAIDDIPVVDTLGAGDFFHGAFSFFFAKTGNFLNSIEDASKLASLTCKFKGTREWINFVK